MFLGGLENLSHGLLGQWYIIVSNGNLLLINLEKKRKFKNYLVDNIIGLDFKYNASIADFVDGEEHLIKLLHHLTFFDIFAQHNADRIVQAVQNAESLKLIYK